MKQQSGFTLVELVVVIAIIGILAAFAVPRFVALESEARTATVQALAGSVRSAAALAHSTSVVQGAPATISMEGQTINMTNGYPDIADVDDTLADSTGFTYNGGTGVFSKDGAPTPANCAVTYVNAAAGGRPTITVNTAGC